MTDHPVLASIQVGLPAVRGAEDAADPMDRPWTSGIFKSTVVGPIRLRRTNLVGDRQADLKNHGGPDKAVLAYGAGHYPAWREELGRPDLPHGAFGENFTIAGLDESGVCIGDTYAIGATRLQVSQPRQPCWKLERRLRREGMIARVQETSRSGWYLRVLAEGEVEAGPPVELLERPFPEWPIARASAVMRARQDNPETAAALGACPLLAASWQERLVPPVSRA